MREIKFRGKRFDTGRWIIGCYSEWNDYKGNKFIQIRSSNGYHNDVIPETVGQFTGLTDKNDGEIYEGDIIKELNGLPQVVKWDEDGYLNGLIYKAGKFYRLGIEVIGNIHDQPELIQK